MNLPPELCYRPENLFFAGIMPPPSQPDVITISNLINPLVDQLVNLYNGTVMRTALHPDGITVRVAVLPIIGDLPAIRKLCGYVAPTAELMCSYCNTVLAAIEDLNWDSWGFRTAEDVRAAALRWQAATTIAAKNAVTAETGIRWSALHRLPYWDPVRSPVVGFMHNMVEGVLVHHLRILWGIGAPDSHIKAHKVATVEDYESEDDYKSSEYDSELEGLQQESLEHGDNTAPLPPGRSRSRSYSTSVADEDAAMTDTADPPVSDTTTERAADPDYEDLAVPELCAFSDVEMAEIRQCIRDIPLPTWVARPPPNLGEASHGKLKADVVLILFTVIFPMIVPEILARPLAEQSRRRFVMLENFAHLVSAANIVASFSTSNALADAYMDHYVQYRTTRQQLWPHQHSVLNHHVAMHNGPALKFWGPLAPLSEFAYERQNGILASISTNNHHYDMDLTMLRQICRRGRLEALIRDAVRKSTVLQKFCAVLFPDALPEAVLSSAETATISSQNKELSPAHYQLILDYVNKSQAIWRHRDAFPHPPLAKVLPARARELRSITVAARTYAVKGSHLANSSILFTIPNTRARRTGFITSIWTLPMDGKLRTFMLVQPQEDLTAEEYRLTPYACIAGQVAPLE
ncbi:hypothetical protein AURDEDRAFT_131254 [Auricularia subglabra TFB-10046 SS5]|uniref:Uncharacterized protein n=1 Tax=Auricularia subglabra (strain TFB-10046 / SS5) TaxID=717982 RepID=J0D600_AURST|nr:hypothetical protein AURDEDRAFT_131254 [Auricularia subglabra TFB-10046 SS5]